MIHYQVVAAIILYQNRILCVQKGIHKYPYISHKYEFPGGKIEPGETKKQALIREIQEELKMEISVEKEFCVVEHTYPDFQITLHSFICKSENDSVTLTEHIHHKWSDKNKLDILDWADADFPIMSCLQSADI